jgi:MFS family permease
MTSSSITLKIHYFLWFGSLGGVLPYTSVFGRHHSDASATEIGLLYTLLPFTVVFAKPVFCWLSDRFSYHKLVLVVFMIATLLGYGFLIITPFLAIKSFWFFSACVFVANTAMGVVISMTDSIVMKEVTSGGHSFGSIRVWGTLGWGVFGLIAGGINEWEVFTKELPYLIPGLVMFIVVLCIDIIVILGRLPDSSSSLVSSTGKDVVHPHHHGNKTNPCMKFNQHHATDNLRNETAHRLSSCSRKNSACICQLKHNNSGADRNVSVKPLDEGVPSSYHVRQYWNCHHNGGVSLCHNFPL